MMLEWVNGNRPLYQQLHAVHLDVGVAPALYFSPILPGMTLETERRPFRASSAPAVSRTANLEDVAFWSILRLAELVRTRQLDGHINRRGERERDFDAVIFGWVDGAFFKDDSQYLHTRVMNEPYGQAGYSNPRADWLMDSLRVTMDREAARPLWREYQQLIIQEAPYTVLYYPDVLMAVRERLQGVEVDRRGFLVSIARWWVPPRERRAGEQGSR